MRVTNLVALALAGAVALASCGDDRSRTELNPAGPPMVRQVFMTERVTVMNGDGSTTTRREIQLAFGDHPDISTETDDRRVINALAAGQRIRVVVDELLDGSTLESVVCADQTLDDIPSGSTPDDLAACSPTLNVDTSKCKAVCTQPDGAGLPIGILDDNADGAPDRLQFKPDVVSMVCGGTPVALDLPRSFWSPSGNQQLPAGDVGVDGLGPAIVLVPETIRTGANCTIAFADSVVDKDGLPVCAPSGGDIDQACPGGERAGDTSLIQFGTEVFALSISNPANGAQNVPTTQANMPRPIQLLFNVGVAVGSVGAISLADENGEVAISIAVNANDTTSVTVNADGGLQPETSYTLTIASGPNGLTDAFGGELARDVVIAFSTAPAPPAADAAPPAADAGVADAGPADTAF
jgi:hypothetical protein